MKVFLVVGTLFPFDRLVKEIDQWVNTKTDIQVTGQIGNGQYIPKNFEYYKMLKTKDFNAVFDQSDLIITHAGMGIVLKSLVAGKPIIVMPRKLELNEHTTDHQMATAHALNKNNYVYIAWDNTELLQFLEEPEQIKPRTKINQFASEELISGIHDFINMVRTK